MNEWKRQRSPQIQQCNFIISQHKLCLSLNVSMASLTEKNKLKAENSHIVKLKTDQSLGGKRIKEGLSVCDHC